MLTNNTLSITFKGLYLQQIEQQNIMMMSHDDFFSDIPSISRQL